MKIPACFFVFLGVVALARAGLQTNIEYGTAGGESLKLDAYVPDGAGPFPAVILVHGGGWNAGDKSGGPQKGYMAPMHEPLQRAGFAWFSINYRLAPKHPYPACIEDVETAIRWVKQHAAEYHLDPKRIALSGESAGGHLVALAAVRAKDDTRLAAIVPFYGLFDMTQRAKPGQPLDPTFVRLFGSEVADEKTMEIVRAASPLLAVKAGLPPFLLVHGSVDQSVPYQQSVEMQKQLRAVGVPCDLITIEGGAHGMLYWDKVAPDYKDRVVAWLQRTLATPTKRAD
ncbi:MAG TPA: alpha/beta hydrolase [Opitutaceae bacterium]|nr:alpha/beta hydrolase [Opitutaceae bacterium]